MHKDPFSFHPEDYDPEYPELRDDPNGCLYLIIMALLCLLFWAGLAKIEGWI